MKLAALPLHAAPRAVIFDMDGLMLDSERVERWAWQTAAQRRGFHLSDPLHARLIGRKDTETRADLEAQFGTDFDFEAVATAARALWHERVAEQGIPLKHGLIELLDYLDSQRIPKALATSSLREKALLSLGALLQRMDAAVCGEDVQTGKPAPDVYLRAAELLRVDPAQCLALEDSLAGIAAAESAGMTVIMIPDLLEPDATVRYACGSLNQVTEWLRRSVSPEQTDGQRLPNVRGHT